MARSSATALAGVSRPTALPIRACLVGYAESTSATRLSRGRDVPQPGVAHRDARRRGRRARGRRRRPISPSASISLNENGTVMSRPSNSGTATWVAASSGRQPVVVGRPRSRGAGQAERPAGSGRRARPVRRRPRPRRRRPPTRRPASVPPAASTVTTIASAAPSSVAAARARRCAARRSTPAAAGRRRPRSRAHSASTKRCCPPAGGRGSRARRRSGRRASRRGALQRRPSSAASTGGAKPWPVSSTRVGEEARAAARGCPGRPAPGRCGPAAATPGGHRGQLHQLGVRAPARRRARRPARRWRRTASMPSCQAR